MTGPLAISSHLHAQPRRPGLVATLTLSELRAETRERGLELAFDAERGRHAIRHGDGVVLEAESLAAVKQWRDADSQGRRHALAAAS